MPKKPKIDPGFKYSAPFSFGTTLAEYTAMYPFASRAEASAALSPGHEIEAVLAYFNDKDIAVHQRAVPYPGPRKKADIVGRPIERWRLRPTHVPKPKDETATPVAKDKPKAPAIPAAPTRKSIVRDLLLTGKPLALETIMTRWGCTKGAASALISDVRAMGYTVDKRPDGTFEIPSDGLPKLGSTP